MVEKYNLWNIFIFYTDSEIEILFFPNGPVLKVRQTKYDILSYITEALLQYWILID